VTIPNIQVKILERLQDVHQQLLSSQSQVVRVKCERDHKDKQLQQLEQSVTREIEELQGRLEKAEFTNERLSLSASRAKQSERELVELRKKQDEMEIQLRRAVEHSEKLQHLLEKSATSEESLEQAREKINELERRLLQEESERRSAEERLKLTAARLDRAEAERAEAVSTSCEMTRLHTQAVKREQSLARQLTRECCRVPNRMGVVAHPDPAADGEATDSAADSVERIIAEGMKVREEFEEQARILRAKHGVLLQAIAPVRR
jgi:chromosome segregation ATPase